jgi:transcriptional repressor NrdR
MEAEVRRRRECRACKQRYATRERAVLNAPMVVKRDGRREGFDREKLRQGIRKACVWRPNSAEQIERLTQRVEAQVRRMRRTEISSRAIGKLVLKELVEVDNVAYVLFASVYLPLTNLENMGAEIERLLDQRQGS